MKRVATAGLLSLLSLPAFVAAQAPQKDVDRAVQAMGGPAVLEVRTIVVKGRVRHLEPDQSVRAGGDLRLASDDVFTQSRDLAAGRSRTEWYRKMAYPTPREFKFTEVVADRVGYVDGVDSNGRTKQSQELNGHAMSGVRLAATTRELARTSPVLVAEMKKSPAKVTKLPDQKAGNDTLPAVRYRGERDAFIVLFDRSTGLPARIRTLDFDGLQGDSTYDLVLSDWRQAGPIKYPFKQVYQLNGRDVIERTIDEVAVNTTLVASAFDIPQPIRASATKTIPSDVPYQWVLRRQFIGTYLDSDAISYDPQASQGLRLADVAPGVSQVVGGSHNSLIVEMDNYLVGFDAPIGDRQSKWTIDAAANKYPGKPFKYVVLTHHHMDHTYGIRTYAAAGATVVVGKGNVAFFEKVLTSPDSLGVDAPKTKITPRILEVDGRFVITDGKRDVYALLIDNPHAEGLLIGYVPDAKLGFVTDIWSPGPPLPPKPNPGLAAVVSGVQKWGIEPARFAGGHGSVADYQPLAKLVTGQ